MRRFITVALTFVLCSAFLTGCFCEHVYRDATCNDPMICIECGRTEGEPKDHSWVRATCENPRTCTLCGLTDGEALGHDVISEASCTKGAQCRTCKQSINEPLGHTWENATRETPKTCLVCGITSGEPLSVLDAYPEGIKRHDGTKFLMNERDYIDLFDELNTRGSLFAVSLTLPLIDDDPNTVTYLVTKGQQIRMILDPDTKQVTKIFVELNSDAPTSEEALKGYLNNVVVAYLAANGCVKQRTFLDYLESSGGSFCSGSFDGVAFRFEVRYHYMTMEIWVEQ